MNLHNLWVILSLVSAANAFYTCHPLELRQRRSMTVDASRGSRKSSPQSSGVALKGKTRGSFSHAFLGNITEFVYRIDKDLGVKLEVQRRAYTVYLDKWADMWGLVFFLLLFFMRHKDDDLFGSSGVHVGDVGEEGLPMYEADSRQQRNSVLRAALDVIHDHRRHPSGSWWCDA